MAAGKSGPASARSGSGPGYVDGVEAAVRRLGESVSYQATPADGKKSPSPGVPTSGGIAPKPLGAVAGAGLAEAEAAKEREHWEGRLKKAKAALDLIAEQREKWADLQSRRSGKCRRKAMRCRNNPKFGKAKGRRKSGKAKGRGRRPNWRREPQTTSGKAPFAAGTCGAGAGTCGAGAGTCGAGGRAALKAAANCVQGGYTKAEGAFRWLVLVCMPAFGHCASAVPRPTTVASAFSSAVASASSAFSSGVASAASSSPAVASKASSLVSCSPLLMPAIVLILLAIACGAIGTVMWRRNSKARRRPDRPTDPKTSPTGVTTNTPALKPVTEDAPALEPVTAGGAPYLRVATRQNRDRTSFFAERVRRRSSMRRGCGVLAAALLVVCAIAPRHGASERNNTRRPAHLSTALSDTLFLNESGWERLMQTQGMAFLRVDPIGCGDACVQWDAFWDEISSTFPGMTWALSCSTAAGACASQPLSGLLRHGGPTFAMWDGKLRVYEQPLLAKRLREWLGFHVRSSRCDVGSIGNPLPRSHLDAIQAAVRKGSGLVLMIHSDFAALCHMQNFLEHAADVSARDQDGDFPLVVHGALDADAHMACLLMKRRVAGQSLRLECVSLEGWLPAHDGGAVSLGHSSCHYRRSVWAKPRLLLAAAQAVAPGLWGVAYMDVDVLLFQNPSLWFGAHREALRQYRVSAYRLSAANLMDTPSPHDDSAGSCKEVNTGLVFVSLEQPGAAHLEILSRWVNASQLVDHPSYGDQQALILVMKRDEALCLPRKEFPLGGMEFKESVAVHYTMGGAGDTPENVMARDYGIFDDRVKVPAMHRATRWRPLSKTCTDVDAYVEAYSASLCRKALCLDAVSGAAIKLHADCDALAAQGNGCTWSLADAVCQADVCHDDNSRWCALRAGRSEQCAPPSTQAKARALLAGKGLADEKEELLSDQIARLFPPPSLTVSFDKLPVFSEAGKLPVWLRAHRRLRQHPRATLVHTDTDVWLVRDLVPAENVDAMLNQTIERYKNRELEPEWCIATEAYPEARTDDAKYGDVPRRMRHNLGSAGGMSCFSARWGREIMGVDEDGVTRSTLISRGDSTLFDSLGQLLEDETGLDEKHAFYHQVLQYPPGTSYGVHTDCELGSTNVAHNDERVVTLLLYLTDVGEGQGGETCFPRRGTCVRPSKGSALIFSSIDAAGVCDKLSEHVAQAIKPGANKLVLQRWYKKEAQVTHAGDQHLQEQLDDLVDRVICDAGRNCRHYLFDRRRAKALQLAVRGEKLAAQGQVHEAVDAWYDSLRMHPAIPEVRAKLGEALFNGGKYAEALPHLQSALSVGPKFFSKGFYYSGACLVRLRRLDEALAQLQKINIGPPALGIAANFGHTDVVRVLLDAGAEINAVWTGGASSLIMASYFGWEDTVCLLLSRGADVTASHQGFGTPLSAATTRGHRGVVRLLSIAGAIA